MLHCVRNTCSCRSAGKRQAMAGGTEASNLKKQDVESRNRNSNNSINTINSINNNRESGGFLATIRTMLFGSRDPESDLDGEMLEELHMVTGCKFVSSRSRVRCSSDISSMGTPIGEDRERRILYHSK